MTNVIDFPTSGDGVADMLANFARRGRDGEFAHAIVVAVRRDGGPEFQINTGDATQAMLLTTLGMLDVIRKRLVNVIEAESLDSSC
jgi:hypothetical protein